MRRLLTWLLVTLGIAALVRRLRRRTAHVDTAPDVPGSDDPADELRRKLAEARTDEPAPEPAQAATTEGPEERRAAVHDEGRAALEEMQRSDEGT